MAIANKRDGQTAYDLDEFRRHHGDPTGQSFTIEVTTNAIAYVYANVTGTIRANKVIFDLCSDDVMEMQHAH